MTVEQSGRKRRESIAVVVFVLTFSEVLVGDASIAEKDEDLRLSVTDMLNSARVMTTYSRSDINRTGAGLAEPVKKTPHVILEQIHNRRISRFAPRGA